MKLDEVDRLIKEKTKYWEERVKDKDLFEVVDEVFDNFTIMTIIELYRRGVLEKINGVISSGKESKVYLGYDKSGNPVAIKIYLTATAEFKRGMRKYITGDPRFEGLKTKDMRSLIIAWARKEYRNLLRMHEAGVKVPKPVACLNNVLVMEFLGEGRARYPLLIEVFKELAEEELHSIYRLVVAEIEKIVCNAKLVHSDLSEYNIVVKPDLDIAIIDVSQAIDISHPNALHYLKRDIENIYRFFAKEARVEVEDSQAILSKVIPCLEKKKAA